MEPLSWIRVGLTEEDAAEAFLAIEDVLSELGIQFEMEYEL